MRIAVASLPSLLPETWNESCGAAIVIDSLRFTSTACQALAAGANSIAIASNIDRARQFASHHAQRGSPDTSAPKRALLCGERHCRPIPGFDLGNSPSEYTRDQVGGKDLIFSTTNGTLAVEAVTNCDSVFLGSLLNCLAVSKRAIDSMTRATTAHPNISPILWIVCAGTDGRIAFEDSLTAGAIVAATGSQCASVELVNDEAWLAWMAWKDAVDSSPDYPGNPRALHVRLSQLLQTGAGGRNLMESGYASDLDLVARLDSLEIVPQRSHFVLGFPIFALDTQAAC